MSEIDLSAEEIDQMFEQACERAERAEAERDAALAQVRRLKEALEPIATAWDYAGALFDRPVTASVLCTVARSCIEAGHFRTARTAVALMEEFE